MVRFAVTRAIVVPVSRRLGISSATMHEKNPDCWSICGATIFRWFDHSCRSANTACGSRTGMYTRCSV
jgi:hypothetical protein